MTLIQKLNVAAPYYIMMLGIVMLFFGLSIQFTGIHNLDIGQNMRYISTLTGMNITDLANTGLQVTSEEAYIMGFNQQNLGLRLIAVAMFFLGLSMSTLMGREEGRQYRPAY